MLDCLGVEDGDADVEAANPQLTPRQTEVLVLVATGRSDAEIAAALGISQHTVHRHVAHILLRLDVSSRAAAAAQAAEWLSAALDRPIRHVRLDDDAFRSYLVAQGLPEEFAGFVEDVNRRNRDGETRDHIVTGTVEEILDRPPISFERFCRDYAPLLTPATSVA